MERLYATEREALVLIAKNLYHRLIGKRSGFSVGEDSGGYYIYCSNRGFGRDFVVKNKKIRFGKVFGSCTKEERTFLRELAETFKERQRW